MATATKAKKAEAAEPVEPANVEIHREVISLSEIVSNLPQSRGMGVMSRLAEMGYPLFLSQMPEKPAKPKGKKGKEEAETEEEDEKQPIWEMLFSEDEQTVEFVLGLIMQHEPDIWALSLDIEKGQIQDVGLHDLGDSEGFDVIYGMRRCLGRAIAHARTPDMYPDNVEAKVYVGDLTLEQKILIALRENSKRKDESPIDRAMTYKKLQKDCGMSYQQIGEATGQSKVNVMLYVNLLDPLLADKRALIHSGKLGVDPANKMLKARKEAKARSGTASGEATAERETDGKKGARDRFPSNKAMLKIYEAKKKPKAMPEEEWELWLTPQVRQLVALRLRLKYVELEADESRGRELSPEESAARKKAEGNGTANGTATGRLIKIQEKKARELAVAMGAADAASWPIPKLEGKLSNVLAWVEEDFHFEKDSDEKVLVRLRKAPGAGDTVQVLKK